MPSTATVLRWEIIDYLCTILDLDTEQELSEMEAEAQQSHSASSATSKTSTTEKSSEDNSSHIDVLGAAGSILKLIVLNCSTRDSTSNVMEADNTSAPDDDEEKSSSSQQSANTNSPQTNSTNTGNPFLSVVNTSRSAAHPHPSPPSCGATSIFHGNCNYEG